MNQRECRIISLHKLFECVSEEIDIDKSFLILGGIKNAVYYFKLDAYKVMGCSGMSEINIPYVFEPLQIEYKTCSAKEFTKQLNESGLDMRYYYIIPVIADLMNKDEVNPEAINIMGQSYFIVDYVKDNKVFFDFPYGDPFISIDILNKLDGCDHWVIENKFEIYKIDKEKLRNNMYLKERCKKSKKELIVECISKFFDKEELYGEKGLVRVDGKDSYNQIIDTLAEMKNYFGLLIDEKKQKSFSNYIYIQTIYMRKLVLSGTDAYYRNEFNEILKSEYCNQEKFHSNIEKWNRIEREWRGYGRRLCKITEYNYACKNPDICLETMTELWTKMRDLEIEAVNELKSLLES